MNVEVERLFHEVADLPAAERTRYFTEHDVSPDTRSEVEALLEFDPRASEFLQHDVSVAAVRALPQLEANGLRCGPYRLLRLLGRGGMGAVYLAERADGEVAQRVAVKLLAPGAGTRQRDRFLQERQILAALSHPNIARMLDAGHVDNYQPYLAMEYVEGRPIDVVAAGLTIRAKIALFLKVCAAVAYLHRNLVVHRDLKPGNILVTSDGEPKLLDFGISKFLDPATDSTVTGMRMLTPDYASPEQVTGGKVSTAADIYSLGAVLYQLLTGHLPHHFEERSPGALERAIVLREVTAPGKWAPELKGDLECILLRALRKDPQDRYPTVEQFADDLEAFLESRPVRARSGNSLYRARKFVRRYWMPVTAASLVIASLSAALYIANRSRALADLQSRQARRLSNKLFVDSDSELAGIPGTLNSRGKLVATESQYLESLGSAALHDKDLAKDVAITWLRIARIQGVPAWNTLGRYSDAEESLRKSAHFAEIVLAADPRNRDLLLLSASIAHDRAIVAQVQHRPDQVVAFAQQMRAHFDRIDSLIRPGHFNVTEAADAAYMYADLADAYMDFDRFQDAVEYARLGVEGTRAFPKMFESRTLALNSLALALMYSGDSAGALRTIHEARNSIGASPAKRLRIDRLVIADLDFREGLILGDDAGVNLNRPREAVAAFQHADDELEKLAAGERQDYQSRSHLAPAARYLGNILRHTNPRRALEIYDHALARIREVENDISARREEAALLASSSYALRSVHRETDAMKRIESAFRLLRDTKDYPAENIRPASEPEIAMRALADQYAETGHPEQALETYRILRRQIMASQPDERNDLRSAACLSGIDKAFAALLRRTGKTGEAETLDTAREELWRRWSRKLPDNPFIQRQLEMCRIPARRTE